MPKPIDSIETTEPPYDSGQHVDFRLHIDHIDNEDKRVWAVFVEPNGPYLTAKEVICDVGVTGLPVRDEQPRAYLTGYGYIWQSNSKIIYIED